jgi:hypothetical protein
MCCAGAGQAGPVKTDMLALYQQCVAIGFIAENKEDSAEYTRLDASQLTAMKAEQPARESSTFSTEYNTSASSGSNVTATEAAIECLPTAAVPVSRATVVIAVKKCTRETVAELAANIRDCLALSAALAAVPSSRFYTNRTTALAPKLSQCLPTLTAALQSSDDWLLEYEQLFHRSAEPVAVALADAKRLLSTAPASVRMPEATHLDGLVKAAARTEKLLAQLSGKVPTPGTPMVSDTGANLSAMASNGATAPALWDDLLLTARAVLAVLPLRLSPTAVQQLLHVYEQYALWVRQHVSPVVLQPHPSGRRRGSAAAATASSTALSAAGAKGTSSRGGAVDDEHTLMPRILDAYFPVLPQRPLLPPPTLVKTEPDDTATADMAPQVTNKSVAATAEEAAVVSQAGDHGPMVSSKSKKQRQEQQAQKQLPTKFSYTLAVLQEPFQAAEVMDERLTAYMEKMQTEAALDKKRMSAVPAVVSVGSDLSGCTSSTGSPTSSAADADRIFRPPQDGILTVDQSIDRLLAAQREVVETVTPESLSSSATCSTTHNTLYCFCRLPESSGESGVLTQCPGCLNWYHPQCVNAAVGSLAAAARLKDFACPVCLFLQGRWSAFATVPVTEWAQIRAPTTSVPAPVIKAGKAKPPAAVKNTRKVPQSAAAAVPTISTSAEGAETVEGKRKRSSTPTPGAPAPRTGGQVVERQGLKIRAAPVVKARDYLTVADVRAALHGECRLSVIGVSIDHVITEYLMI